METRNHHVTMRGLSDRAAPRRASAFVIAAVFIGAASFRFLSAGALENDHFVSLARAHQVLHGAWPVRDFFDPGQPLAYLTSAAAAAIAGPSLLTEAVLAITIISLAASLTFVLARRASGSALIALAAVGLELAAYPRLYNAAKLLIPLVAVWAGWRYADRPSTARLAALAAWTIVAFLWRHDFAICVMLPTAALLFVPHAESIHTANRRGAQYLGLCAAFLLPWAAYVQWASGLGIYLASAFRFVIVEAQRTARPDSLPLFLLIVAVPAVSILLARRTASTVTFAQLSFLASMAILVDLVFVRDAVVTRLPDVVALSALLIAWLAGRLPSALVRWAGLGAVAAAAVVVAVVLARQGYGVPSPGGVMRRFQIVATNLRDATPDAVPNRELLPLVRYLATCTPATERVLVSGFAPQIPVLAGRAFAAGLPAWLGGYYTSSSDVERAAALLSREAVSLVVLLEGADAFTSSWPRLAADLRARGFVERTWQIDDRQVVVWLPSHRARDTPGCT